MCATDAVTERSENGGLLAYVYGIRDQTARGMHYDWVHTEWHTKNAILTPRYHLAQQKTKEACGLHQDKNMQSRQPNVQRRLQGVQFFMNASIASQVIPPFARLTDLQLCPFVFTPSTPLHD